MSDCVRVARTGPMGIPAGTDEAPGKALVGVLVLEEGKYADGPAFQALNVSAIAVDPHRRIVCVPGLGGWVVLLQSP